jgi:SAM-dependent methyltransferase
MESPEYQLMDAHEGTMWWYRALHTRLLDALQGAGGRLLDAGCGTGGFLARLRADRPDLDAYGVEYDAFAAARASAKSGRPVVRGSVNALPFSGGAFDVVVSADVLSHEAVDPAAALADARRVLKPGGRLVVNMPAYRWLHSAHDVRVHNARRQNAGELRDTLERAGFTGVRTRYWNSLLLPLMIASRALEREGAASDVTAYPPWLDATFHAVTRVERRLPPLPAGGSVLAIASRP